ncbi:transposase, family IS1341 [Kalymmatonema gypsitolerans NIES-4073]|nr:transposase, family IS1341 [Scytonema sp. NIES-4073]
MGEIKHKMRSWFVGSAKALKAIILRAKALTTNFRLFTPTYLSYKTSRAAKKTPQQKGTPYVQLRLMALSPRGKQFTADINDHITKQIVTFNWSRQGVPHHTYSLVGEECRSLSRYWGRLLGSNLPQKIGLPSKNEYATTPTDQQNTGQPNFSGSGSGKMPQKWYGVKAPDIIFRLITQSPIPNPQSPVPFTNLNQLELTLYLRIFPYYISQEIYNNRVQRIGNRGQRCHLFPVLYHLKRRKANVSQSKWSYAELDGFIHSVVMNNSSVIRVDADALGEEKNSQPSVLIVKPPRLHVVNKAGCFSKPEPRDYCNQLHPCCGHTNKHNCPNQGLTIGCSRSRGFELYADLVGGRNVAMRTLLLRQDGRNTGLLVTAYPPKSLIQGNNTIVSPFRADLSGVRRMRETRTQKLESFLKPRWNLNTIPLKIHSRWLESRKEDFSQDDMLLSFSSKASKFNKQ